MPVELALYQPEIAQNTGTLLRLAACFGIAVHVIHPTGFPFSRRSLKRGALDYLDAAEIVEHDSYAHFRDWTRDARRRLVLLTTKAQRSAYALAYAENDVLMLGRESIGVPDDVAAGIADRVRIPMRQGLRSINVAIAGALIWGEALRQTGHFETLS